MQLNDALAHRTAPAPGLLPAVERAHRDLPMIALRLHSQVVTLRLVIETIAGNQDTDGEMIDALWGIADGLDLQRARLDKVETAFAMAREDAGCELPEVPDTEKWSDKDWTMALVRDLRDGLSRLDFSLYALEDHSDAGHEGQRAARVPTKATRPENGGTGSGNNRG